MSRVIIVTNSLTGGGAERSMNMLANELMYQGFIVGLLPINSGPADQINPLCEVMPLNRKWPGGLRDTITAYLKFNQIISKWKPDILVLNCDLPELFGALLLESLPLVIVEHTSFPWNKRKRLGLIVRKILSFRGASWVAVSSHLETWPNGSSFMGIIPNPIDRELEKPKLENNVALKRLIFIGRLSLEKRPEWLLEIARHLPYSIEIIGDGVLRKELENSVFKENLSIKFLGQQLRPWDLINKGDLLLIPSQYEGDGLVLIEAMLHRCPVLVADIPDLRRFNLEESNYCLGPEDFISTIVKFAKNLDPLVIPSDLCQAELSSRSISSVGERWAILLKTLVNSTKSV
jgi:glycosyltransferase involved in cell wall biosynthesis